MNGTKKFRTIEGPNLASVLRLANDMGIIKDEYVDIVFSDGVAVLIYYS